MTLKFTFLGFKPDVLHRKSEWISNKFKAVDSKIKVAYHMSFTFKQHLHKRHAIHVKRHKKKKLSKSSLWLSLGVIIIYNFIILICFFFFPPLGCILCWSWGNFNLSFCWPYPWLVCKEYWQEKLWTTWRSR